MQLAAILGCCALFGADRAFLDARDDLWLCSGGANALGKTTSQKDASAEAKPQNPSKDLPKLSVRLLLNKPNKWHTFLGFGCDNNVIQGSGPFSRKTEQLSSWNVKENKENWSLRRNASGPPVYALSPDGRLLVGRGDDEDRTGIRVWNAATGQELFADNSQRSVGIVAFDASGRQFLSAAGNSFQFWKCGSKE